jgi:hypothetical protein
MTDTPLDQRRLGLALAAAVNGPPFTKESRDALAALTSAETVELSRLLAKASGISTVPQPPKNKQEMQAEVVAWQAMYTQTMKSFRATSDDVAAERVAVARADVAVMRVAASGHKLQAITKPGCGGLVLLGLAFSLVAVAISFSAS